MILLIKILIAHFLGDFVLQPKSWVDDKLANKAKSAKLYQHILVHLLLMIGITWDTTLVLPIALIAVIHFIVDLCKVSIQTPKNRIVAFLIDQLAHLLTIVVVLQAFRPFFSMNYLKQSMGPILLAVFTLLLLTSVLARTIKVLISKWTPHTEDENEDSLEDAGKYIGILERLFIFGFVITNNLSAVGFLLAAKSIFRFGDLKEAKDRKLTEYVLIGTLLSFGLSILIGVLYLKLNAIIN